ncbi:MAG TPA: PxxKW family cysteine-rich protein [Candidatus Bilophila faecipullorum]|uniref:PxxKW family cysteine-rich protein n=1 Tax=Candidatus Bilophila faecipullorum TaxID=2838482 RepID=A0A9D1QYT4_9BACT|nr:PxxKW family cysteine-rich protein [uncultured Bilophila sp.]HIW77675.1 PxxKW family cysteine-rich protein [Candidatus Bilophila faecipullorum]
MSDEKTLVGAVKTEQGVELKGIVMQPIIDKCEGCDRVRSFEEEKFCSSYPVPARKWADGRCNFATHIKVESGKAAKVNPLKASKRAAKGR